MNATTCHVRGCELTEHDEMALEFHSGIQRSSEAWKITTGFDEIDTGWTIYVQPEDDRDYTPDEARELAVELAEVAEWCTARNADNRTPSPDPSPGKSLRELRLRAGLTLEEVADGAVVSIYALCRAEAGDGVPGQSWYARVSGYIASEIQAKAERVNSDVKTPTDKADHGQAAG